MKKIISLIAATTLLSSLCSFSVSAKGEVIDVTATQTEMTADELATIKKLNRKVKLDFDPGEFTAYKVTFNVDNAPLSNEDDWSAVLSFEASLTFPNDTCYYSAQSAAVFKDSFFESTGVLDTKRNIYRATFVKSNYDDMKKIESSKIDNAIVMAVIAKPGTVVDVKAAYTEWYDNSYEEVPHTINYITPTLTLGKAAAAPIISVDPTEKEILVDTTLKLTASNDQDAKLEYKYESSNTDAATVDENGVVTAVAVGEAVITVSAEGATPAKCKITVSDTIGMPDSDKFIKLLNVKLVNENNLGQYVYITKGEDSRKSAQTIGEILDAGAVEGTYSAHVAIGVITDNASDVFTFAIDD